MAAEEIRPDSEIESDAPLSDAAAEVPGDGYGSSTIAFSTEIVKVVPPKAKRRSRVDGFDYECGGTVHTVTMLVPVTTALLRTDTVVGGTAITLDQGVTDSTGNAPASGDFVILKNENGVFDVYKVSSYSALTITVAVSVGSADGSGITTKCEAGVTVWFMGAVGDHARRQFRMPASAVSRWAAQNGLCTTPGVGQPILVHSNNITATGYLTGPYYSHPKL